MLLPEESKEEITALARERLENYLKILRKGDYSAEFFECEARLASYILRIECPASASVAQPIRPIPGKNNSAGNAK